MTIHEIDPDAYRAVSSQLRLGRRCYATEVLSDALRTIGRPEEEVGGPLLDALCAMIRSGAVHCSTATPDRKEITIGAATILTPWRLH